MERAAIAQVGDAGKVTLPNLLNLVFLLLSAGAAQSVFNKNM